MITLRSTSGVAFAVAHHAHRWPFACKRRKDRANDGSELRMQGAAHQTAFAAWLYIGTTKALLLKLSILEKRTRPGRSVKSYGHRRPNNRPGHFQSAYHCLNSKLAAPFPAVYPDSVPRHGTGFDLTRARPAADGHRRTPRMMSAQKTAIEFVSLPLVGETRSRNFHSFNSRVRFGGDQ